MFKNFRSYQFAVQLFKLTKEIQLKGDLKDQLNRAATSIVLNLAEGAGKFHYPADAKRFYRIALGSLREVQAILEISDKANPEIITLADKLAGHLYKLSL